MQLWNLRKILYLGEGVKVEIQELWIRAGERSSGWMKRGGESGLRFRNDAVEPDVQLWDLCKILHLGEGAGIKIWGRVPKSKPAPDSPPGMILVIRFRFGVYGSGVDCQDVSRSL